MWFNLTDSDIEAIVLGAKRYDPLANLAKRLREWKVEQASPEAQMYRSGVEHKDEEREVDEGAPVAFSRDDGEDGAYVQTWFWVAKDWNDDNE
jgi:hypothetical protein